jgi:hypothetical protein
MATSSYAQSVVSTDSNGAAMASTLAAGIGAVAMGVFVLLNETGLFAAPVLHGPAGGVTGRTTFATVVWLTAWVVLHARWKGREIAPGRILALTLVFVGVGVLAAFPPLWPLLP